MDEPMEPTDNWCCHRECPYIGQKEPINREGRNLCIRCKTEHIRKQKEETARMKETGWWNVR